MAEETAIVDPGTETPSEPIGEVEQPDTSSVESVSAEGDQPTESTESDSQTTEGSFDANVPYAQLKAHVEELKKTNPALAKELKTVVFAMDAIRKEVPGGVQEIRQIKQTIEELGGTDGIAQLNQERQEWHARDDQFANGDPKVLDEYIQFNPEGFTKLVGPSLDKLAQVDRDAYNHVLSGPFVATLDSWRFADTLTRLAENLSQIVDQKGNQLCTREIQSLQQLAQKYDALREVSEKAPQKKVDAESDKLATQRAEVEQERIKVHTEFVSTATERHAEKQYETLIGAEARNQKLNLDQLKQSGAYERFQRQLDEEIGAEIGKDKQATAKIINSIKTGRREEAVKLSNAKFDAVAPKVVQKVVREWASLMNPRGAVGKPANGAGKNGAGPTPAGVKKLDGPPDVNLVKKTDPNWRDDYMMHSRAVLTTGQRVTW